MGCLFFMDRIGGVGNLKKLDAAFRAASHHGFGAGFSHWDSNEQGIPAERVHK
jgi:hypothetical protein